MRELDYEDLDELLHARIRLAIVSYLIGAGESDFTSIRDAIGATDGNLSVHARKLEEAGYIEIRKLFVDNKPATRYALTDTGRRAFKSYVESLGRFIARGGTAADRT